MCPRLFLFLLCFLHLIQRSGQHCKYDNSHGFLTHWISQCARLDLDLWLAPAHLYILPSDSKSASISFQKWWHRAGYRNHLLLMMPVPFFPHPSARFWSLFPTSLFYPTKQFSRIQKCGREMPPYDDFRKQILGICLHNICLWFLGSGHDWRLCDKCSLMHLKAASYQEANSVTKHKKQGRSYWK